MAESPTIVSLLASATEIVCALGLRDQLIGISHECDHPEDVRALPVLSRPKLDPKQPGDVIDRSVRELVRDGLSVYEVDVDTLERLRPDLIVTQDHCEVCAVSPKDLETATCSVTLKGTVVCSLHAGSLAEVCDDIQRVADAATVSARGDELAGRFRDRLEAVRKRVENRSPKPRVAFLEWLQPPMLAAGWMTELIEIAGGEPVVVDGGKSFSTITWDQLTELDPDIVMISPCGYPVDQSLQELRTPDLQENLARLTAAGKEQVYVADGNAYFNRPGPRLVDSAELLAGLIWPDRCADLRSRYAEAWTRARLG